MIGKVHIFPKYILLSIRDFCSTHNIFTICIASAHFRAVVSLHTTQNSYQDGNSHIVGGQSPDPCVGMLFVSRTSYKVEGSKTVNLSVGYKY